MRGRGYNNKVCQKSFKKSNNWNSKHDPQPLLGLWKQATDAQCPIQFFVINGNKCVYSSIASKQEFPPKSLNSSPEKALLLGKDESFEPISKNIKSAELHKAEFTSRQRVAIQNEILSMRVLAPLCNVFVIAKMAEAPKESTKLLEARTLLKPQSYKVQLMKRLRELPERLINANLNTHAGFNSTGNGVVLQFYRNDLK